jgi:hypothetical protein
MNSEKDYYQLYLKYKGKYLAEQKKQAGGGNTWYKYKLPDVNVWYIYETTIGNSNCVQDNVKIKKMYTYISNSDITILTNEIRNKLSEMDEKTRKNIDSSISYCIPKGATILPEAESIYDMPNAYDKPALLYGKIFSINSSIPNDPPYTVKVLNTLCTQCPTINNDQTCIIVERMQKVSGKPDQFCLTTEDFFKKRQAQPLYTEVKRN